MVSSREILGSLNSFRRNFASLIEKSRDADATADDQKIGRLRSQELAERTASFVIRRSNKCDPVDTPARQYTCPSC